MSGPIAKCDVLAPARQARVSRRHFVSGAAALAGGVATGFLLPTPAWAAGERVDLRTNNWITPVKNQNTCNACTAFAVVATVEGTYNKKKFPGGGGQTLNLSEGQLFFAAGPKDNCATSHWWPEDALAYCGQVGLTRENEEEKFVDDGNNLIRIKKARSLLGSGSPGSGPGSALAKTQSNMKAWIKSTGPVVAVMAEYSDFFAFNGGDNIYFPGKGSTPTTQPWLVGGHVVSIVGYDDTTPAAPYWICKNSYGRTTWNATSTNPTAPAGGM